MTDVRQRVERIVNKLDEVRKRRLTCFGSDKHAFRLEPPISETDLQAFEREHGVRLPADYRAFLKYGGNGGAGPYYGIYPLSMWNDFADWIMDDRSPDFLQGPCPLHPDLVPEADWQDRLSCKSPYQGAISIGTQGCSLMMLLIITGTSAGRVAYVDADGRPPYVVREPDFLSWYERWLDELLHGYKTDSFGYGPGGGEEDFFRIVNDEQSSDALKSEASLAICRLPKLSDAGAKRIVKLLNHSSAGVRSGACAAISSFSIAEGYEEAVRLLDDDAPLVRRQAVWTVMKLSPSRATPAVLRLFREDTDNEVATTAFFQLDKVGALPKSELLRIIQQSSLGNLRYLAAHKVQWERRDRALLIKMLSDPHPQVRLCATFGLRQLKARDAVPEILSLLQQETDDLVISSIVNAFKELGGQLVIPTLIERTQSSDDFHRLDAIEALVKIGDERAVPIAQAMLEEHREPIRRDSNGLPQQSSIHSISDLVRKALKSSPNQSLRKLGE